MKFSIAAKISLITILLVLGSTLTVGGLFYVKMTNLLVERASSDIANDIRNAGSRIKAKIDAQSRDTSVLANTSPIQGIFQTRNSNNLDKQSNSTFLQWKQRLQSIFIATLKSKPFYLKIRLIEKNGQEVIVVGRKENDIDIIEGNRLQNKNHRIYVKETLKLKKGETYISEINLNREHGKVTVPHQEVLRTATPIYDDQNNQVVGLLIITAEIGHEFRGLQNAFQNEHRKIYVTNDQGSYLLHSDNSKHYGFDLGTDYRIQNDIPGLIDLYKLGNKDKQIILKPTNNNEQPVINATKIHFDINRPERFITVAITEPYSVIKKNQVGVLYNVWRLSLVIVLGVILLALVFSYHLSKPIKQITQIMNDYTNQRPSITKMPTDKNDEIGVLARSYETLIGQVEEGQNSLREMNSNLESLVNERTQALESSEIFQRSVIENMADGLITSDEDGYILSFNSSAEQIFQYSSEEVVGKNISLLMPESHSRNHDEYLNVYKTTGVKKVIGTRREAEGLKKDGTVFPIDLSIGEITIGNRRVFSGVVRDITERKQMDKMKNEFVSTVSHELRTPLTAIRGALGLITSGVLGILPEKTQELLLVANNNTNRLLYLINDILDIQKIESGHMDFNFQEFELMPFLEQVILDNKTYGNQYGVEFVLQNKIDGIKINADYARMMQVFANLLSNAAKFSPAGQNVEISVDVKSDNIVQISVTDHGSGIPQEFHDKLFEKFTQSDSSTTRAKGGTGLGLSIIKMIVDKHGGIVNFVTAAGEGTTFRIELPLA